MFFLRAGPWEETKDIRQATPLKILALVGPKISATPEAQNLLAAGDITL